MLFEKGKDKPASAFLTRLGRDKCGNTLMLFAFSLIPIVGMVGSGLDLSRLYLVKTRLQHSCDAGALAGRKRMGSGAWTTTGTESSSTVANRFFDGNFPANAYGATGTTRAFTEAGGNVNGTASATVPMTLMSVLNAPTRTLTVSCSAIQQVPNTDIMFVLDNTASMSRDAAGYGYVDAGNTPSASSRIVKLKANVKCFYEAMSKLDTGEPTCDDIGGVATTSRLRFGLVPYAINVNIGGLGLPAAYFAQNWSYQSREWSPGSEIWQYKQVNFRLTGFNNSTTTFNLPLGAKGADQSFTWDGCVEENTPVSNINAIPSATTPTSLYAPTIPRAVYYRAENRDDTTAAGSMLRMAQFDTNGAVFNANIDPYYTCPARSWPLQTYLGSTGVSSFNTRVNSMVHAGNTRHDVGLLWGARLLSPRGIFGTTNATPATGGKLYRHLIFMTDGDAKANECDYSAYGIPWFDKREVPSGTTITNTNCQYLGNANLTLTDAVYARSAALCTAIKAEADTILWVISYGGSGIDATTKSKLQTCATDANHFFDATDDDKLKAAFKQIAGRINQLRLTQ
ncbi:TadE/TadG family type IV pilus assembly protein [uncultured Sphingomonas sp.]|uniref:TadE/TadG family type IV pilus assembly protein n=1 Tax=uncultured Sphingomonas sp. TaxID=158754 RepID=UPI0035CAAF5D